MPQPRQQLTSGILITIEGGEGAGKTTQTALLVAALKREGYDVISFREPGGTALGESLRSLVIDNANAELSSRAEALLLAAARAQSVTELYKPYLEKKYIVILDRYIHSSYVYQGFGRELGYDNIKKINDFAIDGLLPDITYILDVDYKTGNARRKAASKLDRFEVLPDNFFQVINEGFHRLATEHPHHIALINASQTIESIHQELYKRTKKLIRNNLAVE